jgi:hypothetical protein
MYRKSKSKKKKRNLGYRKKKFNYWIIN